MRPARLAAVFLPCLVCSTLAPADDFVWIAPAGGYWLDPANWGNGHIPQDEDADVIIGTPGDYDVVIGGGEELIQPFVRSVSLLAPGSRLLTGQWCCAGHGFSVPLSLRVHSFLINNGEIPLWGELTGTLPSAYLGLIGTAEAPCTLGGSGAVRLAGGSVFGTHSHHLAGHTIIGHGHIDLARNDGEIILQPPTPGTSPSGWRSTLELDVNTADITCEAGAPVEATILSNDASFIGAPGVSITIEEFHNTPRGVIDAAGGYVFVQGPLTRGTIRNTEGGAVYIVDVTDATLVGEFVAARDLTTLDLINHGVLTLELAQSQPRFDLEAPVNLRGVGEIRLVNDPVVVYNGSSPGMIGIGQTITGAGRINHQGPTTLRGAIAPGDGQTSGAIRLAGSWVLHPAADLYIDVFDADDHDSVSHSPYVSSTIAIAGRVHLEFHGRTPALGEEFRVFWTTVSYSGAFSEISSEGLDPALSAILIHRDGEVVARIVSAGCTADLANPAGVLDFIDVITFISAFNNTLPHADLAPPQGVHDYGDVLAYLTAFAAGCP